jgi:hypothetical protein
MGRIRFVLVVAALSGVGMSTVGHGQDRGVREPACTFPASEAVPKPVVVGRDSITKRVEVIQPQDAPVRIVRVDFTAATLTIGAVFRFTHNYSLEVVNVTDQIASGLSPFVWAFSGNAQGAHHAGGHGPNYSSPLGPGQRRVLRTEGPVTEEMVQFGDDVHVRVGIDLVKFDTCTWNNWNNIKPQFDSK